MKVEIFQGNSKQWDEYILNHSKSNIYHLFDWGLFLKDSYKITPINLVVYDGNNIVGIVPLILMRSYTMKRVMVSLPYFCIGGILADNAEVESLLSKKIKDLTISYKCKETFLKADHIYDKSHFDYISHDKSSFVLPLDADYEKVFSGFQKQIRRQIRRGYKSGCEIDISPKYIKDFYNIYRINMRLLGSPVHKRSFYTELINRFSENYNVLVVLYENNVIGAQLLSYFKETVYLPLASSLREYNSCSPNHLLYWESIKYGCENGYEACDFGRSTIGTGPYIFKKQWNALENPLNYCYFYAQNKMNAISNNSNKKLELISKLWKRTPLIITNFLGPQLSKWLP